MPPRNDSLIISLCLKIFIAIFTSCAMTKANTRTNFPDIPRLRELTISPDNLAVLRIPPPPYQKTPPHLLQYVLKRSDFDDRYRLVVPDYDLSGKQGFPKLTYHTNRRYDNGDTTISLPMSRNAAPSLGSSVVRASSRRRGGRNKIKSSRGLARHNNSPNSATESVNPPVNLRTQSTGSLSYGKNDAVAKAATSNVPLQDYYDPEHLFRELNDSPFKENRPYTPQFQNQRSVRRPGRTRNSFANIMMEDMSYDLQVSIIYVFCFLVILSNFCRRSVAIRSKVTFLKLDTNCLVFRIHVNAPTYIIFQLE